MKLLRLALKRILGWERTPRTAPTTVGRAAGKDVPVPPQADAACCGFTVDPLAATICEAMEPMLGRLRIDSAGHRGCL